MTQLRAATRLVQAATDSDRPRRAEALRAIYSTITEGFAIYDLTETTRLLAD
jgi:hypothetical protein